MSIKISIPVTKILVVWLVNVIVGRICGFNRDEVMIMLLVGTLVALIPLRRFKSEPSERP